MKTNQTISQTQPICLQKQRLFNEKKNKYGKIKKKTEPFKKLCAKEN